MSEHAKREIDYLMDENTTDDRSVFAVIDGGVSVGRLKELVERLELEAEARGYERGYHAAAKRYGPVLA